MYAELRQYLEKDDHVALITVLENKSKKHLYSEEKDVEITSLVEEAYHRGTPIIKKEGEKLMIIEPFSGIERMVILGGGHVSLALATFAKKIGFYVVVVDDRCFFANVERFPSADEVICDAFIPAIENLKINSRDYIVLVTRGHSYDADCLRTLVRGISPYYMGMIGSKRRVAQLKEMLMKEGIAKEWLDMIHSPIGLSIGAITPEEIGISILAEVIRERRSPQKSLSKVLRSDVDLCVIEHLAKAEENKKNEEYGVVTVISSKGSTPRKAGAKMVVYADGRIFGTVGGGCAESDVIRVARNMIGKGTEYKIVNIDLTDDIAEEEGMVCGGLMTMLVEVGN